MCYECKYYNSDLDCCSIDDFCPKDNMKYWIEHFKNIVSSTTDDNYSDYNKGFVDALTLVITELEDEYKQIW